MSLDTEQLLAFEAGYREGFGDLAQALRELHLPDQGRCAECLLPWPCRTIQLAGDTQL